VPQYDEVLVHAMAQLAEAKEYGPIILELRIHPKLSHV
jgi:hypothetical protein